MPTNNPQNTFSQKHQSAVAEIETAFADYIADTEVEGEKVVLFSDETKLLLTRAKNALIDPNDQKMAETVVSVFEVLHGEAFSSHMLNLILLLARWQ